MAAQGKNRATPPAPPIVNSPDDLPVKYRETRPYRDMWAVIMPYPDTSDGVPCQGQDYLFFPHEGYERLTGMQLRVARNTCAECPVVTQCQEWGLAHEAHGVWGGLTATDRWEVRNQRGQLLVDPMYAGKTGFDERNWSVMLDRAAQRNAKEAS